ncbi:hypothetical protein T484DRAFT_1832567, partial [Baffinella frigidus]
MTVHRLRHRPPAPSTFHTTPPRQWPDITPLPGRIFSSSAFPEGTAAERLASTSELLFLAPSARPAPPAPRPAASPRGSAPPPAPHRSPEPPSSRAQTAHHPAERSPPAAAAPAAPPQETPSSAEEEEDNSPESAYARAAYRARQERAGQAGGGQQQGQLFRGEESPSREMQHERHDAEFEGREGGGHAAPGDIPARRAPQSPGPDAPPAPPRASQLADGAAPTAASRWASSQPRALQPTSHLARGSVPPGARAPPAAGGGAGGGVGGGMAGAGFGQQEQHGGG